jgi:hypothetical protein
MNTPATEQELLEMMQIWQLKGLTLDDCASRIPLGGKFTGFYMPAVDDYCDPDSCLFLDCDRDFTSEQVFSYLSNLWSKLL